MFKINRHTLDNGLRLVHYEDASTQMVALNIVYDVGARDEHPQHTGFAHLFEHLMFGGSVNIPDYDTPLQLPAARTMHGPTTTLLITTSRCPKPMWKPASGWNPTVCWDWPLASTVWRYSARW